MNIYHEIFMRFMPMTQKFIWSAKYAIFAIFATMPIVFIAQKNTSLVRSEPYSSNIATSSLDSEGNITTRHMSIIYIDLVYGWPRECIFYDAKTRAWEARRAGLYYNIIIWIAIYIASLVTGLFFFNSIQKLEKVLRSSLGYCFKCGYQLFPQQRQCPECGHFRVRKGAGAAPREEKGAGPF